MSLVTAVTLISHRRKRGSGSRLSILMRRYLKTLTMGWKEKLAFCLKVLIRKRLGIRVPEHPVLPRSFLRSTVSQTFQSADRPYYPLRTSTKCWKKCKIKKRERVKLFHWKLLKRNRKIKRRRLYKNGYRVQIQLDWPPDYYRERSSSVESGTSRKRKSKSKGRTKSRRRSRSSLKLIRRRSLRGFSFQMKISTTFCLGDLLRLMPSFQSWEEGLW